MLRVAILDDYQRVALRLADWSRLGSDINITVFDRHLSTEDEAAEALRDFDVLCLVRERMPIPKTLLARLSRLKFISVTGPRNTVIDVEAAAERGVVVSNTPSGGGIHAPSELTFGLMLSCARNLAQEERNMRSGGWQKTVGTLLHGKTIGLLGFGRLGQEVARLAAAFGMVPIAWSPNLDALRANAGGAEYVSKEELFRRSDYVSIHMVLAETTRGMVGRQELSLMKPSAILLNTSRGPLVNEAALIEALVDGRIRGAALDVYDQEPLPADHPLRTIPNLVLSPHIGFVVEEALMQHYNDTIENILAWRDGNPIRQLEARPYP